MDFNDFQTFLGKSGKYLDHPPKFCASLVWILLAPEAESAKAEESPGRRELEARDAVLNALKYTIEESVQIEVQFIFQDEKILKS